MQGFSEVSGVSLKKSRLFLTSLLFFWASLHFMLGEFCKSCSAAMCHSERSEEILSASGGPEQSEGMTVTLGFPEVSLGTTAAEKTPGSAVLPPENRSSVTAKVRKVDKTDNLRVIVTVRILESRDVENYPNLAKVGQDINVLFVFYPRTHTEGLDPDNPVNKERLAILEVIEGEILGMEVSLSGPSIWFGHKAWKETSGGRQ